MTPEQVSQLIADIHSAIRSWKDWDHAELFVCYKCRKSYWLNGRHDLPHICRHVRQRVCAYADAVREHAELAASCARAAIQALRRGEYMLAEQELSTAVVAETGYDKHSFYLPILQRLRDLIRGETAGVRG